MTAYVPISIRRHVRDRAEGRCEYCLLHEDDTFLSHEPDHIIAEKHGGKTSLDNLAWSCFDCNRFKGSDIASIDAVTGDIVPLFNPRADKWSDHFNCQGATIQPVTPTGRVTEQLLKLNLPARIEVREILFAVGRYAGHQRP